VSDKPNNEPKNDAEFSWDADWDDAIGDWEKSAFTSAFDESDHPPALTGGNDAVVIVGTGAAAAVPAAPPTRPTQAGDSQGLEEATLARPQPVDAATVEVFVPSAGAAPSSTTMLAARPFAPSSGRMPAAAPRPSRDRAPDSVTTRFAAPMAARPAEPNLADLETTRAHFDRSLVDSARQGELPDARSLDKTTEASLVLGEARPRAPTLDPESRELDAILGETGDPRVLSTRSLDALVPKPSTHGLADDSLELPAMWQQEAPVPGEQTAARLVPVPPKSSRPQESEPPPGHPISQPALPLGAASSVPASMPPSKGPPPLPEHALSSFPPASRGPVLDDDIGAAGDATEFSDERDAKLWLQGDARQAWLERIAFFEEEAEATSGEAAARLLLAASELAAMAGQDQVALSLARSGLKHAPHLEALAKQVRQLVFVCQEDLEVHESIADEYRTASTPEGRAHALLMMSDASRYLGGAEHDLEIAVQKTAELTGDARQHALHAALRIQRGTTTLTLPALPPAWEHAVHELNVLHGHAPLTRPVTAQTALRGLREALAAQDVPFADEALQALPALGTGRAWASALVAAHHDATRPRVADHLVPLENDANATRALLAFGVETGEEALVAAGLARGVLGEAETLVLGTLAGALPEGNGLRERLLRMHATPNASPLASALAGMTRGASGDADAPHLDPRMAQHPLQAFARSIAAGIWPHAEATEALAGAADAERIAAMLALRMRGPADAARRAALSDVGDPEAWVAHAVVAAGAQNADAEETAHSFARAQGADTPAFGAVLGMLTTSREDRVAQLGALAAEPGVRGALAAFEAALLSVAGQSERAEVDPDLDTLLERAHQDLPQLGLATFLGEHVLGAGDRAEAARWIEAHRSALEASMDSELEQAVDGVRQAWFYTEDVDVRREALRDALRQRPLDLALYDAVQRECDVPFDLASHTGRLATLGPATQVALRFELAYREDVPQAARLAAATELDASGLPLGRVLREQLEAASDTASLLAERLLIVAKETVDAQRRLETYERLAELDTQRGERSSALLWHRSILEEWPHHLPSLRYLEHALVSAGRDEELTAVAGAVARALARVDGPECLAHAFLATRRAVHGLDEDAANEARAEARDLIRLAAAQGAPSLWAVRAEHARARAPRDDASVMSSANDLVARVTRPMDKSALWLRYAEAAARSGAAEKAVAALEAAVALDPEDGVAWRALAGLREQQGDLAGAAEAFERLAMASTIDAHRLDAEYQAAAIWEEQLDDQERAMFCLERAAQLDPRYRDVFSRLSQMYTARGKRAELAALLRDRLARAETDEERVTLQVELGGALLSVGDDAAALDAYEAALALAEDHPAALARVAELRRASGDRDGAEAAYVRLVRLLPSQDEQRAAYLALGALYTEMAKWDRAEVAYREVLKRDPAHEDAWKALVDALEQGGQIPQSLEAYEEYLKLADGDAERQRRLIELSARYEPHNARKAELVLDGARKEFPASVVVLRAMAEFYTRQRQLPAVNILLDRAAGDARRALATGRFTGALFETLAVVAELRPRGAGGAAVIHATLAAYQGRASDLKGIGARAIDPRLDDLLAPELLSAALRVLLSRTGDALDLAAPLDLQRLEASPLNATGNDARALAELNQLASQVGLPGLTVWGSDRVGKVCLPVASNPPTVLVGRALLTDDGPARTFLFLRALKLIYMRSSALVRTPAPELAVLIGALLKGFNPNWVAPGLNAAEVLAAGRRLAPFMPRELDPQLGVIALEAAAGLANNIGALGAAALLWGNRAALLGVGDPNAAVQGLAHSLGQSLPEDPEARAAWFARTPDARDLLTFSVSDAHLELRRRGGV
jgi:tetratricopeptide (TPR) repeat protein